MPGILVRRSEPETAYARFTGLLVMAFVGHLAQDGSDWRLLELTGFPNEQTLRGLV
jgi:hypothetical protein